jgi:hypothetical protein
LNLSRYLAIRESILAKAKEVEDKKRISYTAGDDNVLRNFVSDSEFVGTNQLQNCLTHFMKQVRGISSFVVNPEVEPSESLASRAADVINYVCLMVANAEEMGRDTGLGYVNQRFYEPDPKVASTWLKRSGFSFVATNPEDEALAKVATDFFDYNFGKDDV